MWGNYDDSGSAEAALHEAQLPAQLQREGVAGGGEVAPDGETDHTDLTPLSRLIPTAARLLEDRETVLLAELCSLMYAELGKERCQAAFIANAGGAAAFFMSRPEFQVSQQGTQGVSVALAKSESEGQTVPANKSKGDPEVSGLEPDVLRFLYGLNLLFGSNEWPQTRDELSARAGPFGTGIGSKLYQLSHRIGAVKVEKGTHLHWSNDKLRQIIDATPQTIRQGAEAMLAEHGSEQDIDMGGFLKGPAAAVEMMSILHVASVDDVIEKVSDFAPLHAMSSDVRVAVRKANLYNWCRFTGKGIRVKMQQAIDQGAVVVGGAPPHEWVGLPGPPRPSTPSDVSVEFAPSETSSDARRKAFNPKDFDPVMTAEASQVGTEPPEESPSVEPSLHEPPVVDPITKALQELAVTVDSEQADRPADIMTRHAMLGIMYQRSETMRLETRAKEAEQRAEAAEERTKLAEAKAAQLDEELRKALQKIIGLEAMQDSLETRFVERLAEASQHRQPMVPVVQGEPAA
tara:strand:- start:1142 stop:2692 length:1551 start_codon:yes stop_codon:yes gene_type:complete